ncbi:MAG: hypothetical protein COA97_06695 [Flavobacteriales bacterium]|nr:MAG: hypothetical protein COA97_06695 [Flavobacteriales bacterium]
MPETPLVTICVQTYNHENYIKECLVSLVNQQTNFEYEIIVGEDDSSDKTREICIKFASEHPDKIKLFLRDRNNVIYVDGKPTGRFNFMQNLKESRGKYMALCPGDDFWIDSFKLQKQFDFMEENPDYSICYHEHIIVDEKSNFIANSKKYQDYSKEELLIAPSISTATSFFKNNIKITKTFIEIPGGDLYIWHSMGLIGKGKCIPNIKSAYRIHSGGIYTANLDNTLRHHLKSYFLILENLPKELRHLMVDKIENRIAYQIALAFLKLDWKKLSNINPYIKKNKDLSILNILVKVPISTFRLLRKKIFKQ